MLGRLARRLLSTVPVMGMVGLIVFSLLYITPGDPALVVAGDHASPEQVERIRRLLGLDQSYLVRLGNWAWNVVQGDLGRSIVSGTPVSTLIGQRIGASLSLIFMTLFISVAIAVPLGVLSAWRHNSNFDRISMAITTFGFSIPGFVVGYALVYIFSIKLNLLPVQGYKPPAEGIWAFLSSLLLPSLSLGFVFVALIARITRSSMLDALSQDYVRTARAKGVGEFSVLFVHALKNAAIPVVTMIGIGFGALLGGSVVIETVFSFPGLGRLTVDAIASRDYPVIQGIVLLFSLIYVLISLVVDLLYTVLDQRITL